jgi:hypothetical protein
MSRRAFIAGAGAALLAGVTYADPLGAEERWVANHVEARLLGTDGTAIAGLPRWSRMRIMRELPNGTIQVWVPRLNLVGRVPANAVGPVALPSPADLEGERLDGPTVLDTLGVPGRVVGSANVRTWPMSTGDSLLRTLGHNAPLRVLDGVQGEDSGEWYRVNWLDAATYEPVGLGYVHNSVVRLPRLRYAREIPDRADDAPNHFEADLKEPALITAYEGAAPVWSTLTLKGTIARSTPLGYHRILWRVPNETMTSERVYPPIPRDAPGGYYLTGVLWTQYFTSDGASIHYNYWSSNWGYAGSHGCLGIGYNEAKFAWNWARVGTPVYVFT